MEQNAKLIHCCHIPLRWGDMDAYGHLNNTLYFRYCEEARVQALYAMGAEISATGISPVIINASCTFLKQIVYPDVLRIETYVSSPGRSSFETWYRMYSEKSPEVLVCEGQSKIVWIDHATEKSVALPDKIRQQIPT